MAKASTRVPLTLCCAQEDASHIRPVLTLLEREEGYRVRLIEGVEEDPYLLGSSLDRQLGACVIIACLSDALGPAQFRRIEGVYSARKGPDHYLDTIFVEPDETLAMAESVRSVVAKASSRLLDTKPKSKPRPKPRSASSSSNHLRDVVGVTNLSAVGTDAPRKGLASLEPSDSALGLGTPAPISLSEESSAGSTAREVVGSSKAGESGSSTPAGDFSPASSMSAASSQVLFAEETRKNPAWVAPVLFLIFLAVAGTVVLLLLLQQQQTPEWLVHRGAPQLGAELISEDASPEPDAKNAEDAKSSSGEADTAAPPSEPADPTSEGSAEPGSEGGEAETGGAASEDSVGEPPSPASAQDEEALIVEAIETGEMRAVDLILIAKTSELSPWRDAADRCRTKSVNGVRGWRLPTLDELKTIRKARMVERNYRYWSSTLATKVGTGHSHVYVLDLSPGTIEPLSKEAADVRVLCVRAALDRK